MKKVTEEELKAILNKHQMWLDGEEKGERADLSNRDLSWLSLKDVNLKYANLKNANLCFSDLKWAELSNVNLEGADLKYVKFDGANFTETNLKNANLKNANLENANLENSDLKYSNLKGTNLKYANFKGADLDYSCLPLWCGSLKANFDDRQIIQIIYHAVKAGLQSNNTSNEVKSELKKMINLVNQFHRSNECGKISEEEIK